MSRFFKSAKIENNYHHQDKEAKKFFASNSASVYQENAEISYLRTKKGILRLTKTIDKGAFGSIRIAQPLNGDIQRLVKVQIIHDPQSYQEINTEAEINHAMGIASAELIYNDSLESFNRNRSPITCYQEMRYLGKNLTQVKIKENPLDIAIKLLLKVDNLHTGQLALNGIRYAHRDIKAENVLIDTFNNVHLIDFGNASSNIDGTVNHATELLGSRGYLPIDKTSFEKLNNPKASELFENMHQNTNFLFHDKIATLRVIFNPLNEFKNRSVLTEEQFENLPISIRTLFDTAEIGPMLSNERKDETEKYLAAVLIAFNNDPDISAEAIFNLKTDLTEQKKLINQYWRLQIIQQLEVTKAKKMVSNFTSLIKEYDSFLVNQFSLKADNADLKFPLAWEKHQILQNMLTSVNKETNPAMQLKQFYKDFMKNKKILSQAQNSEDNSYWKKIKFFFADLFANYQGKSITKTIENSIAKQIVNKHHKNSLAVIKQQPDSDSNLHLK